MVTTRSGSGVRNASPLVSEPGHGSRDALLEPHLGREAEELRGLRGIERAAWLPIRHRGIPTNFAVEADGSRDDLRRLPDRRLDPGSEVDRFGIVVAFS